MSSCMLEVVMSGCTKMGMLERCCPNEPLGLSSCWCHIICKTLGYTPCHSMPHELVGIAVGVTTFVDF
eukprot:2425106-Amphidinium_carterae.1